MTDFQHLYFSALKRYENERHERTAWITNTSWLIGKGGQVKNLLLIGLRNFIVKITPTGCDAEKPASGGGG